MLPAAPVRLTLMTEPEFAAWLPIAIRDFAKDKIASEQWSAERALVRSAQAFHGSLPRGIHTPGHQLYLVRDAGESPVGSLWLRYDQDEGEAFLYSIAIYPERRGQGLGSGALLALCEDLRRRGARSLSLNVFFGNHGARRLYERLGFVPASLNLSRRL